MHVNKAFSGVRAVLNKLLRGENNQSGIALIEFAYSLPIFMTLGITGTELSNMAVTNMQVSQVAMSITDNLSRAKLAVPLGKPQFREHDINDAFLGAGLQDGRLDIYKAGRVVVSSLQRNTDGGQWIAWQRCQGLKNSPSLFGVEGTGKTGTALTGIGLSTGRVAAEQDTAIIVTEITYEYQPLISNNLLGSMTMRAESAFYVRDDRDLTGGTDKNGVYNPTPVVVKRSCSTFTAT